MSALSGYRFADCKSEYHASLLLRTVSRKLIAPSLYIISGPRNSGKTHLARAADARRDGGKAVSFGFHGAAYQRAILNRAVAEGMLILDNVSPATPKRLLVTFTAFVIARKWPVVARPRVMEETKNGTLIVITTTAPDIEWPHDIRARAKFINLLPRVGGVK